MKVVSVNLARIALETDKSEEKYLESLDDVVWMNCITVDRIRHIIRRNVEKGLLPNFTYGLIDFEHLYSTIGFLGIYETMKHFGYTYKDEFGNTYYKDEAFTFGQKIFDKIRETMARFKEKYNCDYQFNIEQIPGESAASKLMKKDKYFYPETDIYDLPLYGNQFIPLGIQTTIQERVKIASKFDSYCSGGRCILGYLSKPCERLLSGVYLLHVINMLTVNRQEYRAKPQYLYCGRCNDY